MLRSCSNNAARAAASNTVACCPDFAPRASLPRSPLFVLSRPPTLRRCLWRPERVGATGDGADAAGVAGQVDVDAPGLPDARDSSADTISSAEALASGVREREVGDRGLGHNPQRRHTHVSAAFARERRSFPLWQTCPATRQPALTTATHSGGQHCSLHTTRNSPCAALASVRQRGSTGHGGLGLQSQAWYATTRACGHREGGVMGGRRRAGAMSVGHHAATSHGATLQLVANRCRRQADTSPQQIARRFHTRTTPHCALPSPRPAHPVPEPTWQGTTTLASGVTPRSNAETSIITANSSWHLSPRGRGFAHSARRSRTLCSVLPHSLRWRTHMCTLPVFSWHSHFMEDTACQ